MKISTKLLKRLVEKWKEDSDRCRPGNPTVDEEVGFAKEDGIIQGRRLAAEDLYQLIEAVERSEKIVTRPNFF